MPVETIAKALFEAGLLDATSMETRVGRSRNGRQLLDGIVADGVISESSLVTQLARALSVPRYDPKERSPEPEAVSLIDPRAAEELGVLPVAVRGGGTLLWVALCDPTDENLLSEITHRTGRRVKACLIGPRELSRALQRVLHGVNIPTPLGTPPVQTGSFVTGSFHPAPMPTSPGMPAYGGTLPPNGAGMPVQTSSFGYPFITGGVQPVPVPGTPSGTPPIRSSDVQRLDDELAQVRRVVKVLTQMLVERGNLDGEELKRRLRAERDRKG